MYEGQGLGSEPSSVPPPRAAGAKLGVPALALAAVAIAIALITMVAFPGPAGPQGEQGPQGPAGADGNDGDDGTDGTDGTNGADGLDGTDGTDGTNGADGLDGADGADGVACWDLNGNGIGEVATEDINGDTVVDVLDCTGPQGPPGPGTIMAYSGSTTVTTIGSACTRFTGMDVTITVPTSGYIVISASVTNVLSHLSGTRDVLWTKIANVTTDCVEDEWMGLFVVVNNEPSSSYWVTTQLQRVEWVTAGTYTYYVNGMMVVGGDPDDDFWSGNTVAVFYPA